MATDAPVTTTDIRAVQPQPTSEKSVNLTAPNGTKVTASSAAAEKLKAQGWKAGSK